MTQIQQPGAGGDKFDANEHEGQLLLFFPYEYSKGVLTVNGASDVVSTRIVNLDTGRVLEDAKVWGKAMVPQLKGFVPDGITLGRVVKGVAKGSNNPPWILQPFNDAELARAEAWIVQEQQQRIAQPQGPTGPAGPAPQATGGWGQQAAPAPSQQQATGGWGNPPAQEQAPSQQPQSGWGASSAPAATAGPAAPAQGQFAGQWGAAEAPAPAAPAPAPTATSNGWGAPAPQPVDPGLAQVLTAAGYPPPANATMDEAVGLYNTLKAQGKVQ